MRRPLYGERAPCTEIFNRGSALVHRRILLMCHCEAPKGPWQSREGTSSSYKVPIKTYQPIASVAALTAQPLAALPPYGCGVPLAGSERLAGWQYSGHVFYGMRPPSLSFRGAKRRGNLGEAVALSPMAFLRSDRVLRDCHVGCASSQ